MSDRRIRRPSWLSVIVLLIYGCVVLGVIHYLSNNSIVLRLIALVLLVVVFIGLAAWFCIKADKVIEGVVAAASGIVFPVIGFALTYSKMPFSMNPNASPTAGFLDFIEFSVQTWTGQPLSRLEAPDVARSFIIVEGVLGYIYSAFVIGMISSWVASLRYEIPRER